MRAGLEPAYFSVEKQERSFLENPAHISYAKNILDRKCGFKMFLSNLSVSLLKICDANHLTYETASEQCCVSARYFGDIVRRRVTPSIETLEKICIGFGVTPNDLLLVSDAQSSFPYRQPMRVTQVKYFPYYDSLTSYPVCPRCSRTLEREYQTYCDRCGQRLDW